MATTPDSELWRQSLTVEAPEDETERFLDLAGFTDGLLDDDDAERVAERLALDPTAAADVFAARVLAQTSLASEAAPAAVIARACALIDGTAALPEGTVVAFAPRPRHSVRLSGVARWGSLAAAVLLAGWLGFTLGMDTSQSLNSGQVSEEGFLHELFNPSTGFMNDLSGTQT